MFYAAAGFLISDNGQSGAAAELFALTEVKKQMKQNEQIKEL